jgi:hypothetical protein
MKLTIKSLVLLTAFAVVGAVAGCSGSDGEPASLGSQISTPSLSTMPASNSDATVEARVAKEPVATPAVDTPTPALTPTSMPTLTRTPVPIIRGTVSPEFLTCVKTALGEEQYNAIIAGRQDAVAEQLGMVFPCILEYPQEANSIMEMFGPDSGTFTAASTPTQDPPSTPPVGDLPYKPDGNISPPMPDLPSLVAPVAQASEVWEPIKYDGQFRSLGAVTAHDVDVLELADGSYRAYYAVEDRKIMSSRSTDGLTWVKDSGVRISNVAFPNAVLLDNGDVRLFYQDGMSIGSSISSDSGITFTKESGLRVSLGFINGINLNNLGAPSTIRLSDGTYRMYFRGGIEDSAFWNGQQSYVFSASSLDALEFIVDPGIRVDPSQFNDGGTGAPPGYERGKIHWVDGNDATLEPDGSVQLYFFSGFCFGLCMAISEDGLEFNNYEQVMSELVTPMNELAGGNGRIPGDPSILRTSNDQRIMYFGQGGHDVEPHELWGVYIAEIKN